MDSIDKHNISEIPIIDLSKAPGAVEHLQRSKALTFGWKLAEILFVTNRFQISSRLRVKVLRLFGAKIGENVIYRPSTRVKSPWQLEIGDRCWIGDGVWFHNRDKIVIGNDVVVSQESYFTTGAHAFRSDMALVTKPIVVESGAWVSSRCVVLGGTHIGTSSVISPMEVVKGEIPANSIISSPPPTVVGTRFKGDESK